MLLRLSASDKSWISGSFLRVCVFLGMVNMRLKMKVQENYQQLPSRVLE